MPESARIGAIGTIEEMIAMSHPLPQRHRLYLTDGGLETDLIYRRGIDLPAFAAIALLASDQGQEALDLYFRAYLDFARRAGTGFLLESASWRGGPDWATSRAWVTSSSS